MRKGPFRAALFIALIALSTPFVSAAACPGEITSSGTYSLTEDLEGAPNFFTPFDGWVCVMITASNVVLDCNGHSVSNNGTGGVTFGIGVSQASNVTIVNCPSVADYNYSVYLSRANYSAIRNVTAGGAAAVGGIFPFSSYQVSIENCTAFNTQKGFVSTYSSHINITNCTAFNNSIYGFQLATGTDFSALSGNTAFNNSLHGFSFTEIYNCTLTDNLAFNNGQRGFSFGGGSADNNLTNNVLHGQQIGVLLGQDTRNNRLTNNTAYDHSIYGFYLQLDSSGNILASNLVYNGTIAGIYLSDSHNNLFFNNTVRNNPGSGFYLVSGSENNTLSNNSISDNNYGVQISSSIGTEISNCTLSGNAAAGVYSVFGLGTTLRNLPITGGANGIRMDLSSATAENISLSSQTARGFRLLGSQNSSFSNIVVHIPSGTAYAVHLGQSSGVGCSNITFSSIAANGTSNYVRVDSMAIPVPITLTDLTINDDSGTSIYWPHVNVSSGDEYLSSATFFADEYAVSIDSEAAQPFNTTARITLNTSTCPANIYTKGGFPSSRAEIVNTGSICTDCTILSCSGGKVIFEVSHFSGYASGWNSELTIDNDGPKLFNETITFTANYSNITDHSHIPGATCALLLYNGSSYSMPESGNLYVRSLNVTEAGTHDYNVSCSASGFDPLNANDTFQILSGPSNATWAAIDLYGANATVGTTGRYAPNITAGNLTTEGGNVTNVNLTSNASTDRWAGFYGNITGNLVLAQAADVQMVYVWPWDSAYGGTVCASTLSAFTSANASGASGSDIDSAWSFPSSATDSGTNTFNNPNCSLGFGTITINESYYADTGSAGGFRTCTFKTASAPSKNEMLFCTNITENGPLFNGGTGDFEMMVPTEYGPSAYETYYFYLNLG